MGDMPCDLVAFAGLDICSPDNEIIAYCANPLPHTILSVPEYSNKVVRISDQAVVKFGVGVTKDEAENQKRAYEIVDQGIVRIPCVYRFFTDPRGRGYIIMEYIKGRIIDPLEEESRVERLADVLAHLASLRGEVPGRLGGGPCRGLLFPDTEDLTFDSVEAMERWFNSRLLPHHQSLSFEGCELVLCHLDIAPRNILWTPDDTICLLDWASAGYYPRVFEFCAQSIISAKEGKFSQLVRNAMASLSVSESAQAESILRAWTNFQKYYFAPTKPSRNRVPRSSTQCGKRNVGHTPILGPLMPQYPQEWLDQYEFAR